jgi:hypothetical protein
VVSSDELELTGMGGLLLLWVLLKQFLSFRASFNAWFAIGPGGIPGEIEPGRQPVAGLDGSGCGARTANVRLAQDGDDSAPVQLRKRIEAWAHPPKAHKWTDI